MCGGGGYSAPDPMKQAEGEIKALQEQYRLQEETAIRAEERAAAKDIADREQWSTDLGGARGRAEQSIYNAFDQSGVGYDDYMDRINAALDLEQSGKSYGMDTAFSTDLGANILDDIRNAQIRDNKKAVGQYAPDNFGQSAFASTADDAVIDAILDEQFGGASDAIMRAYDRGTLNQQGFDYAMNNLNTQKSAAMSQLQDIGGGVLSGYRDQLQDVADSAYSGASSWDFGDTFDPSSYQSQLDTLQGELGGALEGDLRTAVGGQQFFDTSGLISKAGVSQGQQNTGLGGSGGLLASLQDRKKKEEDQRGLGTQGSF